MKLRTKLVLLLSAALVVTMVTSTWLRIRWTRQELETRARDAASETALAIAQDLTQSIKDDWDDDDISERLKYELRRHQTVANIEFTFDSDEDTTVSIHLDFAQEDPQIRHTARPARKQRPAPQRRDEARRALLDHGFQSRPPGDRLVDPMGPMWRTPDRPESTRWARLAPKPAAPQRHSSRAFLVDLRDEQQKQGQRYLDVSLPVDPEGPRHGRMTLRTSLEPIDRLVRTEQVFSLVATGVALIVLMLSTVVIVQRVVGRPVEALEEAMRAVEAGDLAMRVPVVRDDEVGALSRGFNEMVARLSEADREIRAFNRRLADEVRSATLDLERKNEALGQLNRLLREARSELGDKERLAALGQLAAQLAHELGTPLGSVSGHLQLALSSRDLAPDSPLRDRLLVATREIERISKIVRDYLDSTRPVAPARVPCDVRRLVDEAVGIAVGAQERPGLAIEQHIDEAAAELTTDPGLVRQILVNLLTNAIDATEKQARSSGARIAIRVARADRSTEIAVADNGSGISAEDAARIFEPFYTTKGRGKGTGLGLAICRELASALGGRIAVTSAPGQGSTFTLWLPQNAQRTDERRVVARAS